MAEKPMNLQNYFYGHATILRRYCSVANDWLLPGHLQHGWHPDHGHGSLSNFVEPWPMYIWARHNLEKCIESGFNVVPVGAPYLYLLRMQPVPRDDVPIARGDKSLLAYPYHGWERQRVNYDFERYAEAIDELVDRGFGPVTVCLYWMEHEVPEYRRCFEQRGYRVITYGHREGNEDFLYRQHRSIVEHAFVTSNRIGSCVFYALATGRPTFIYGPPAGCKNTGDPTGEMTRSWEKERFPELMFERFDGECHSRTALDQLGEEFVMSPDELRKTMAWDWRGYVKRPWRRFQRRLRTRYPWVLGYSE